MYKHFVYLGSTSVSFEIDVIADSIPELDESFDVLLISVLELGQSISSVNVRIIIL